MSEKSDDLQILKRFHNGNISAFEELILKYQDRIYNLCRHMLGNPHDAEDAALDTVRGKKVMGLLKKIAREHQTSDSDNYRDPRCQDGRRV